MRLLLDQDVYAVSIAFLRSRGHDQAVHTELQLVLEKYSEDELRQAFVVVEPGRHRFRRRLQGTN